MDFCRGFCLFWICFAIMAPTITGFDCRLGCNPVNGYCENSGECRCKPGWQGVFCNQCVPYPGCLHGSCTRPWQCICEEGWLGSLCDIDIHPCAGKPCSSNSTCVETGDGRYMCICEDGFMGKDCLLKKGPCYINGSPCQNGGTCIDDSGFASYASCQCPSGYTGTFCEINEDDCNPNPCFSGGICTDLGNAFICHCPDGFTGQLCRTKIASCLSNPCENGGTCHENQEDGFECICKQGFFGKTCSYVNRTESSYIVSPEARHVQHYNLPTNAFHRSVHHHQRELLKITMKETIHNSDPLLNKSQLICFIVLGLLTCLVVLGTTGIVFFSKCEIWLANAKYSHLLHKQRSHFMRSNNGEELSVNIIFPDNIKLTNYSKNYTAI